MYKKISSRMFSEEEMTDLLKAWFAISLAFAIVLDGFSLSIRFAYSFVLASLTVGIAFIAHELSHRAVARHFGCHAEFRSFDQMLILAVLMSFLGFVLAAPGAVMISGPVGRIRNGKISASGPAANLVLALLFLVIMLSLNPSSFIGSIVSYGFVINSWLALFNLLPFGNFDGRKILRWSRPVYSIMLAAGVIFLVLQAVV